MPLASHKSVEEFADITLKIIPTLESVEVGT